jgi:hypothetical protein
VTAVRGGERRRAHRVSQVRQQRRQDLALQRRAQRLERGPLMREERAHLGAAGA